MTTLSIMKARIADELARGDLTSQIAYAITDAIERYQSERMWFNESRDVTFSTVASQEYYTSSDHELIPNIYTIDYVVMTVGGSVHSLTRSIPEQIEALSDNGAQTGEPSSYAYFQKKIRLYPVPDQVYTVRVAGHVKVAAPASDDEADNVWMTDAERLIRARAKYNIALDVMRDQGIAQSQAAAVNEAFEQLKGRTNRQVGTGIISATCF